MKPAEREVLTFSCVPKTAVVPDGTGDDGGGDPDGRASRDPTGKKVDFYWRNTDLTFS